MKTIAIFLFSLSFWVASSISAHDIAIQKDGVTVIGEGFIDAEPDMLDLQVDLFAIKPTLKEAKAVVDQRYHAALKVIKQFEVADTDIKLTRIHSQVEYDWNKQRRIFKGYRISRNLQIAVRDLSRYPDLLQSLVDAGISNINRATPRFSDDTVIKEQALSLAVDSAKRKAASLAKQVGRSLGAVRYIAEANVSSPHPQPVLAQSRAVLMDASSAATPPPARFGTQRIYASVTVEYRLQ